MENGSSGELILAVIVPTVNGTKPGQTSLHPRPLSPLTKTQSFHIFSMLNMVESHTRAVNQLVGLKGGLEAVQTLGVRDMILLYVRPASRNSGEQTTLDRSDMFFSSRLKTRPA